MVAAMREIVNWLPGVICLWMLLWPIAHLLFWQEYRRIYPDRPAPRGPAMFLFHYYKRSREWRILTTRQSVRSLERRRLAFRAIEAVGVIVIALAGVCAVVTYPKLHR